MSEDTTTIRVEKDLRDTLKERRTYPKEKLSDVIEREIREKTAKTDLETINKKLDQIQGAQAETVSEALEIAENASGNDQDVLNRIDDLETNLTTQIERLQK